MAPEMGLEIGVFCCCEFLPMRVPLSCVSQGPSATRNLAGRERNSHKMADTAPLSPASVTLNSL